MFYLGIDIGESFHVASLMDDKNNLFEKIAPYPEVEIGMEATGHYWLALYSFLIKKNYVVHVVNPIQTDSWRNSQKFVRIKPIKLIRSSFPILFAMVNTQKPHLTLKKL